MSLKSLSFSPLHYHRTVSPVFGFLHMFPLSLINKGRCNCTKRLHTTFAFVIDSLLATYNRWVLLFLRFALQQSTISSSSSKTTSHTTRHEPLQHPSSFTPLCTGASYPLSYLQWHHRGTRSEKLNLRMRDLGGIPRDEDHQDLNQNPGNIHRAARWRGHESVVTTWMMSRKKFSQGSELGGHYCQLLYVQHRQLQTRHPQPRHHQHSYY